MILTSRLGIGGVARITERTADPDRHQDGKRRFRAGRRLNMTSRINRNPATMIGIPAAGSAEAAMNRYVGDRIRVSRISRGYRVDELAAKAGLNPVELGAMETGLGRVPALELVAIANALGVQLGTLFGARSPRRETAGWMASPQSAQPSGEAARIARAYDLIRDPSRRNMLLALSELLADGSEAARADAAH